MSNFSKKIISLFSYSYLPSYGSLLLKTSDRYCVCVFSKLWLSKVNVQRNLFQYSPFKGIGISCNL